MLRYALLAALVALPALAQDLTNFEKILIPGWTHAQLNGNEGTTFAGRGIAMSTVPARYWPSLDGSIGTLQEFITLNFPGTSRAGRVLYVERARANDVSFDVTLSTGKTGESPTTFTTMPVVRETDLLSERSRIIGIRSIYDYLTLYANYRVAIPRFRHHLRIYDVDGRGDAQVLVRRIDQEAQRIVGETTVTLDVREGTDPSYPAYAEILLPETCHPFSSHTPCAGGSQWIEIEPLTSGLRYWAMVTATDNTTRQVSVKWPQ